MTICAILDTLTARFGVGKELRDFIRMNNQPVLSKTIHIFDQFAAIDAIYLLTPRGDVSAVYNEIICQEDFRKVKKIVNRGKTWPESVYLAQDALLEDNADVILLHDGLCSDIRPSDLTSLIAAAREVGIAALLDDQQKMQKSQAFRRAILTQLRPQVDLQCDVNLAELAHDQGYPLKRIPCPSYPT